ncbi:MAG TPA: hypothetical protein ENK23_04545 [Sorangium sp.]|nr:hypothetical protein [Sorangium sp.]
MEIVLEKRAAKQIRMSAAEAIEDGDNDTLREDILDSFPEDGVEMLEQVLPSGDFMDLIGEVLDEWSGDDVDELFELLEIQLTEYGVDLKFEGSDDDLEENDEHDDNEMSIFDYDEDI